MFLLTGCSVGSSKPNEKLDPPPGGRKTRELFLLLGSTPLKVVVVVMAPKSEVGWRGAERSAERVRSEGRRAALQTRAEKPLDWQKCHPICIILAV